MVNARGCGFDLLGHHVIAYRFCLVPCVPNHSILLVS